MLVKLQQKNLISFFCLVILISSNMAAKTALFSEYQEIFQWNWFYKCPTVMVSQRRSVNWGMK